MISSTPPGNRSARATGSPFGTIGDVGVNGVTLHCSTAGTGPRMLLLHGIADSGPCWGRSATSFAERYQVVVPDQRGHGLSEPSDRGYGLGTFAADAVALIDKLRLAPTLLVGHSLGARVAMTVAASHPHLISGLVLEDPTLHLVPRRRSATDREAAQRRLERFAWLRELRYEPADVVLARRIAESPTWSHRECEAWVHSKYQVAPAIWMADGADEGMDWRTAMAQITCPTLIIRGQRGGGTLMGSVTESGAVTEAIDRLTHVNAVQIAGAGHLVHLDQHDQFVAALDRFLPVSRHR